MSLEIRHNMFASLVGFVQKKYPDHIILFVNGVGYKVLISSQMLNQMDIGAQYFLFIETAIGEDFIKLYGFMTEAEKNWFLLLSSVNGVGGKAALAILSVASPSQISDAILLNDKAIITKAAGVGPKLADRILNELKHKKELPACYDLEVPFINANDTAASSVSAGDIIVSAPQATESSVADKMQQSDTIEKRKIVENATSALVNLGYSRSDALKSVVDAQSDETMRSENALIAAALKNIAKLKEEA